MKRKYKMQTTFKIHHIGYVTNNIDETANEWLYLGYTKGPKILDTIQNTYISLLYKENSPSIELVEPVDDHSSVNKILKKVGVSPYHICYEVPNINDTYKEMIVNGYIPLFRPVEAIAFNNKLISYLYKKEVGYIELINAN